MTSLRIALCQLNLTVGALDDNARRVLAALGEATDAGCDVAIFPELAVTGYPPEDLVHRPGFVADSRHIARRIAAQTGPCAAVFGFVDGEGDDVYNAAALCANGEVLDTYHKRELPNYGLFDEIRHFRPGLEPLRLFDMAGTHFGISICEDIWVPGGPVNQLAAGGAQIVLNINASPYHFHKYERRIETLGRRAREIRRPIAYVNLVGAQDEVVFDGTSMVIGADGEVLARAAHFDEELMIVDVPVADPAPVQFPVIEVTRPAPHGDDETPLRSMAPLLDDDEEIYRALVLGTRDYVHKNGFREVALGLSGGIDSALVAAVSADALGPENVHAVLMPSRFSSDHSVIDAEKLATNLGIDHRTIEIEPAHEAFLEMLAPSFAGHEPDVTEENVQSRIRGVLLMALSNKFGWLVMTTGNKSESAVGYSTLYGDTAGAFAIIKDVWKLQVYELCRWRNRDAGHDLIPESILTKAPSAELRPDQRDDQSLPPYEVLDPLLIDLVENDRVPSELIADGNDPELVRRVARLVDIAEFKRRQNPPGVRVSTKAFGRDRRMPITNRYRGLPIDG